MQGLRNPVAISCPVIPLTFGGGMMRELTYMGQKTNESKKGISRIPLRFSVSQKVRFVFTCFL